MLVSVILVTYNASKYLTEAIDSVINQSHRDFELIIIDDGSTDGTSELVSKYKLNERVRYYLKDHTGNVGGRRNEAIALANGEVIAFIDSDDIWNRNKLEVQLEYLERNAIVCSNAEVIDEDSKITGKFYFHGVKSDYTLMLSRLVFENNVITSSVAITRKLLDGNCKFEDKLGFRGEDYTLWLSLAEENNIQFINRNLLKYRLHPSNLTFLSGDERNALVENTIKIRKKYWKYEDAKVRNNAYSGCVPLYKELVKTYYRSGDTKGSELNCRELLRLKRYFGSFKYIFYFAFLLYLILANMIKSRLTKRD